MKFVNVVNRGWQVACMSALALLLVTRAVRYAIDTPSAPIDQLLGSAMIFEAELFLWTWVWARLLLLAFGEIGGMLGVGFLVLAFLWAIICRWLPSRIRIRHLLIRRENGVWHFQPLLVSVLCTALLVLHFLFDANVFIFGTCTSTLLLLWLPRHPSSAGFIGAPARRPGRLALAVASLLMVWLAAAGDAADRVAIAAWGMALCGAWLLARRWLGTGTVGWLLIAAIIPTNLLPAALPLVFPFHDGTRLQSGLAYSFCENPSTGRLYVSMPRCSSVELPSTSTDCIDGSIEVYHSATLVPLDSIRLLSEDFVGRLEQLTCFDDEVQVALQGTRIRGVDFTQTALAFPIDAPIDFRPNVAGKGMGSNVAYDARRDAAFYVGEFTHRVVRIDRRTGVRREIDVGQERSWTVPIHWDSSTGSFAMVLDPASDRLVLYEFHAGRSAYSIDLETLELDAQYLLNNGGSWGVTFDSVRNQIIVASSWGIEILDAATGQVLVRKRFGLGSRMVLFDADRDRVYLASTIEGKLRVLDRETLEVLEQIPVGLGMRNPYQSRDGRRVFAGSYAAHYYWLADRLGAPR